MTALLPPGIVAKAEPNRGAVPLPPMLGWGTNVGALATNGCGPGGIGGPSQPSGRPSPFASSPMSATPLPRATWFWLSLSSIVATSVTAQASGRDASTNPNGAGCASTLPLVSVFVLGEVHFDLLWLQVAPSHCHMSPSQVVWAPGFVEVLPPRSNADDDEGVTCKNAKPAW
jgi:hypothetical protein